jgi:ribokinase
MATKGADGVLLLSEDGMYYKVPAYKPPRVVDPTGSGDAFAGAFLVEYLKTGDSVWSTALASAAASFVVEGIGPSNFGERHQTEERAEDIIEKVEKV